jgi:hypothetical protein
MKSTTLFAFGALIATCLFASAEEPKKGPSPEQKAAMKEKQKALLEKYDADKDGKLSETERQAAKDAGEKMPDGKKGGKKGKKDAPAGE